MSYCFFFFRDGAGSCCLRCSEERLEAYLTPRVATRDLDLGFVESEVKVQLKRCVEQLKVNRVTSIAIKTKSSYQYAMGKEYFMRIENYRCAGIVVLTLIVLAGCGGNGGPKLYSVTGKVVYKDKPVPNANVMFAPEKGTPATGKTDNSGYFSLSTNDAAGSVAGPGVWTITAFEPFEAPPAMDFKEAGKLAAEGKLPVVVGKSIIPEKYGVGITSSLKMEVSTTSSKNNFDIVLTD